MAPFGRMSSEFFLMPHKDQSLADEERNEKYKTIQTKDIPLWKLS
jgi:hypothetical protein